jgi:insertion element IS1 protein InsB
MAVDRIGKRVVDIVLGTRGTETGIKLWNKLLPYSIQEVKTDYWKAYPEFIPAEIHQQSKKETYTIEGFNSLFRHFLARLRRKSKCYSKSMKMLYYSVVLLATKINHELSILF